MEICVETYHTRADKTGHTRADKTDHTRADKTGHTRADEPSTRHGVLVNNYEC